MYPAHQALPVMPCQPYRRMSRPLGTRVFLIFPCFWRRCHTPDGRLIIVDYEEIDDVTVYPVPAYEVDG